LGLEYAIAVLRIFEKENGRKPVQRDKGFGGMQKALRKKYYWKEFNITTWNGLLTAAFGEVNIESGKHQGINGLKKAKKEVRKFYQKHQRKPTARDKGMSPYINAISRGHWLEFEITSWNKLLLAVFGEVNKENNLYTGYKGVLRAKKEMIRFELKYGRKPRAGEREMAGIEAAIKRRYWKNLGIERWNDMLKEVFGEVNKKNKIWTGEEGLKKAKKKIKKYQKVKGRVPSQLSKGMAGIAKAVHRGYWVDFGINMWNDLIIDCGLQPNERFYGNLWKTWEEWCEKAISILYPSSYKIQPETRLPNGKIPDMSFQDGVKIVLVDAKLNANARSVKEDIDNYVPYCDQLEFWCLFGTIEPIINEKTPILFIFPNEILDRVKDIEGKIILENDLDEMFSQLKNSESSKNSNNKEICNKSLLEYFEN
jgi:hypothetical protein